MIHMPSMEQFESRNQPGPAWPLVSSSVACRTLPVHLEMEKAVSHSGNGENE